MAELINGVKGVGSIVLVDKTNNLAHRVITSNQVTFNTGLTQEVIYGLSELGIENPVKVNTTREDPTIQITFPRKSLTAISMATGRKWQTAATADCFLVRSFIPTKAEYAAAVTGFEGFGVQADPAAAIASVAIKELEEPLTRAAFGTAGTALTGTKSYAIGANGALKFSADVIGNPVTMEVPYTLTNIVELGEEYYRRLHLNVTLVMDDFKLMQLEFTEAVPVLDNSSLNFGETGVQATFRSILTGETCVGYKMRYLDVKRKC